MEERYIKLYIDGSCINNGKPNARGGIGIYIDSNLEEIKKNEVSVNFKKIMDENPTNQKTELLAMYTALSILNKIKNKNSLEMVIITDSKYVYNIVTKWIYNWRKNGWMTTKKKPITNAIIVKDISTLLDRLKDYKIDYKHVKSHTKKPEGECKDWIGNNKADILAKKGSNI